MSGMSSEGNGQHETAGSDSTSEQVSELVHGAAEQVQQAAADLRGRASGRLHEQVDQRSSQVGEQLGAAAHSLRGASVSLKSEGKAAAAGGVDQAAQLAEQVGGYLRDTNADRILGDVEHFIRRRPWAAAGGGFVVGLVASRLLKASSADRYQTSTLGSPPRSGGWATSGREPWSPAEASRTPAQLDTSSAFS